MPLSRRQLAVAHDARGGKRVRDHEVRSQQGRSIFYVNNSVSSRVTALGEGLLGGSATTGEPASPGLVAQFALREAGVNFAGAILQSINDGQPRLSARYVPESLLLAVPSVVLVEQAWASAPASTLHSSRSITSVSRILTSYQAWWESTRGTSPRRGW